MRSISFFILTFDERDNLPIISTGSMSKFEAFQIMYYKRGFISLNAYSGAYEPPNGTVINDGHWHSVVVTYDRATLRIYVDGRLDSESNKWNVRSNKLMADTMNTQGDTILLGHSFRIGSLNNWKGKLKNVKFYNTAIPGPKVSYIAIYASHSSSVC